MKYLNYLLLLFLSVLSIGGVSASELTAEQMKFRSSIFQFLKEEGFMPTIDDEDSSVNFKKEGILYWISVGDSNPFYVEIHRSGLDCTDADLALVLKSVNEANRKIRCAKAMLNESSVAFAIEMYCHSSEEFRYVFYKSMVELENIKNKVTGLYNDNDVSDSTASASVASSPVNLFFPVYGFTVGKTTLNDLKSRGYNVKKIDSGASCCDVNGFTFWDHDKDGVCESAYMVESDPMPDLWSKNLGLTWNLSYNQLVNLFKNLGFSISVEEAPKVSKFSGRKTLSAEFYATSPDGHLIFDLDFDYGNDNGEGYSTNSANSLYSIRVKVE